MDLVVRNVLEMNEQGVPGKAEWVRPAASAAVISGAIFMGGLFWLSSLFGPFGVIRTLKVLGFASVVPGGLLWLGLFALARSKNLRPSHLIGTLAIYLFGAAVMCRPYDASVIHFESFEQVEIGMTREQVMDVMKGSQVGAGSKWGGAFAKTDRTTCFTPLTDDWRHDSDIGCVDFQYGRVVNKVFMSD